MPNLVRRQRTALVEDSEWAALFGQGGAGAGLPLGTARWMEPEAAIERFGFRPSDLGGGVFIGEGFDWKRSSLGYADDRHVCLVSGSRGGKGVGVIVPNLSIWPGSCIVVDPKGENATVTARRRGEGSEYAIGLGQKVCVLDPYGEVQLPGSLKARYNPLDAIDPESDFAVDDAARIAAALVVVESRTDPYWELAGRNLIKGLILHVLSAPYLAKDRNLVMVRRLLTQGDWLTLEKVRNSGLVEELPSAFDTLWSQMRMNPAFNGVVAGVGEQMIAMADKQRSGVLEAARTNTEFVDSTPMQRQLETSDFDLGELKTNPAGLTIYLTLPQRFMETHYRWLRLMITLAVGEMERIKGRTATGHPTLFVLDEFAGLKRMEVIENAAAQAAGMGIKFLFVIQNLAQLNEIYEKSWETFFGNSGLKLFFQIDDDFSRSYLSRQLGELETTRQTRSGSQSQSTSLSTSDGQSFSTNFGSSSGLSRGRSVGHSLNFAGLFRIFSKSHSNQLGASRSRSDTKSWGRSRGTSFSTSHQTGDSATSGWAEGVHKRPLLNPDEIGRLLARVDDRRRPGYPGLVLALVPGEHPLLARRINYFESPQYRGYFDPHPDHPPPPTLAELAKSIGHGASSAERPASPRRWPAALVAVFGMIYLAFALFTILLCATASHFMSASTGIIVDIVFLVLAPISVLLTVALLGMGILWGLADIFCSGPSRGPLFRSLAFILRWGVFAAWLYFAATHTVAPMQFPTTENIFQLAQNLAVYALMLTPLVVLFPRFSNRLFTWVFRKVTSRIVGPYAATLAEEFPTRDIAGWLADIGHEAGAWSQAKDLRKGFRRNALAESLRRAEESRTVGDVAAAERWRRVTELLEEMMPRRAAGRQ